MRKISKNEDEIETYVQNEGLLKNKISCLNIENDDLKKTIDVLKENETLLNNVSDKTSDKDRCEIKDPDIASSNNILKCEECDYVLREGYSLKDHKKFYHEWECDWCEFETKTEIDMENHVLAKHECVFCSFKCICDKERISHIKDCEFNVRRNIQATEIKTPEDSDKNTILENENTDTNVPSTSKCGKCDYESDTEVDLKAHIESDHEDEILCNFECETCDLVCKTGEKLKKHLCRIEVKNPTFGDFYISNWVVTNRCNPIFHKIKNQEIAILHCKECMNNENRCSDKFPLWLPAQEDGVDGSWHLDLLKFLKDGSIEWPAVITLVKTDK